MNKAHLSGTVLRHVNFVKREDDERMDSIWFIVFEKAKYKCSDGEYRHTTNYVLCEATGRTARVVLQYYQAGAPCLLEGYIKSVSHKGKYLTIFHVLITHTAPKWKGDSDIANHLSEFNGMWDKE